MYGKLVLKGLNVSSFVTALNESHQNGLRGGETLEEMSCLAGESTYCETLNPDVCFPDMLTLAVDDHAS